MKDLRNVVIAALTKYKYKGFCFFPLFLTFKKKIEEPFVLSPLSHHYSFLCLKKYKVFLPL